MKNAQALVRHSNPTTTLKHYQKTLDESLIAGVESWDAELRKPALKKVPGPAQTGGGIDKRIG
ncbi:MAG: hypothetical protein ACJ74Z_03415 [Bryobacteraceae bacterium]